MAASTHLDREPHGMIMFYVTVLSPFRALHLLIKHHTNIGYTDKKYQEMGVFIFQRLRVLLEKHKSFATSLWC